MPAARSKRCFYDVLGCAKNADDKALKKAYRKQAIKWHPDKHVSESEVAQKCAEEQFKAVAEAYDVLSDPNKRKIYDQLGHAGLEGGMPEGGMAGGMGSFGFPSNNANGSTFVFRSSGGHSAGGVDPMQMFAQMFGEQGLGSMMGGMHTDEGPGIPMGGTFAGAGSPFASLFGSIGGTAMGPSPMDMDGATSFGKRRRTTASNHGEGNTSCLLPVGCAVRVRGLRNAAQHNGRTGVVERHDAMQNRYIVRVDGGANAGAGDGGERRLALQRANLLQMMRVQIAHLSSRPELNGRTATLLDFDEDKGRYVVQVVGSGETLSLSRDCVMLPEDAAVLVGGLTSRAGSRLNGRSARVLGWSEGRYTCAVAGDRLEAQLVKLKPSNCVA